MNDSSNLHELVDALSDRSINDEQLARLNHLIETEATARVEFMNLMRLEAELGSIHQPLAAWASQEGVSLVEEPHHEHPHRVEAPQLDSTSQPRKSAGSWQFMGALAASLAITAVGSSWLTYEALKSGSLLAAASVDEEGETVPAEAFARVAATRNCRWSGDRTDLGFGAEVAGGQLLELETGLAELTFGDGARLVLEGPASFRLSDAETVELYSGRVAVAIPEDATGFSVRTPRLVVAESGAQYGVLAGADGYDEVHVFEGAVKAKAVDGSGKVTGVVNLASLEAARFRSASRRFAVFNADDQGFVRSLDTRSGPGEGLLAFDNFAYPTGPVAWQNGGFGWAGPWADLEASPSSDQLGAPTNGVARGSIAKRDLISLGNRFVQSGNGNRVRRTLSTSIGGVFDAGGLVENADGLRLIGRNGSTVYLSFLQRVSKVDDVFYGVEFHRGDGNFNRVLCVGNGVVQHGYGVTSNFQQGVNARFASLGEENTEVNLIVVRIEFGDGDQDIATVYRNPSSLVEESSCEPTATLRGNFAFDRVSLGNFEGNKIHEVDELRIGTDFGAVTGRRRTEAAPELAWMAPFSWSEDTLRLRSKDPIRPM